MKNIKIKSGIFFLLIAALFSCDPRIEMDLGQWGDHAFIDNVQLFKLDVDEDVHLVEWYYYDKPVTGVRTVTISAGKAVIDSAAFSATVKLRAGESLEEAGLLIYHRGTLVEPLDGAPKAGIVHDLSEGSFKYRLYSADGSSHDWTINIVE